MLDIKIVGDTEDFISYAAMEFTSGVQNATFAAGDTEACATFTIMDDDIVLEPVKQFSVTFSIPPEAPVQPGEVSEATVTVTDDDSKPQSLNVTWNMQCSVWEVKR